MKLINSNTNREIKVGDQVRTFRDEVCELMGFEAPRKPSSTGRVYVKFPDSEHQRSFFPSVIGCEIVKA